MTNRNLPTLRAIAADPALARSLDLDTLDALLSEVAAETTIINAAKKALTGELERRYQPQIDAAFAAEAKDFGTVHVLDGGFDIEVNVPKKVEWDEDKVVEIGDAMKAAGDDPTEYIKVSYSVEERKFTAWPEHIRRVFEPARALKPGTRTVKLARKVAA